MPGVLSKGKLGSESYYQFRKNELRIIFMTLVTMFLTVGLSEYFIMPFIGA